MVKLTKDDLTLSKWDVTDYLTSEKKIVGYFEYVFSQGDPDMILRAVKDCARARERLNKTAEKAKLSRTTLYRYLNGKTRPDFVKFIDILASIGIGLKPVAVK